MAGNLTVSILMKLIDGVTAPVEKMKSALDKATEAFEKYSDQADKAFEKGEHLNQTAEGMIRFGERVLGVVEGPLKKFESFEESMHALEVQTGTTGQQFEVLEQAAKRVGSSTKFGPEQAAQALIGLRRQAGTSEQAVRGLDAATNLAYAAQLSLTDAATSTTRVLKSFGLGAEESARVNDALFTASRLSGASVTDLAQGLGEAGRAARVAGIGLDRTTTLLAAMAKNGVDSARGGAVLERVFNRLNKPSALMNQVFQRFNIHTRETVNGVTKLRDPLAVLGELQGKMAKRGLSAADQMQALQIIFRDAAPDVQLLLDTMKSGKIDEFKKAIERGGGSTQAAADKMRKGGVDAAAVFHQKLDALSVLIGEKLAPTAEKFYGWLSKLVDKVSDFVSKHPALVRTVVVGAAALGGMAVALGNVVLALAALNGAKGLLTLARGAGSFAAVLGPIVAIAAAFTSISLAVMEINKYWKDLNFGEVFKGMKQSFLEGAVKANASGSNLLTGGAWNVLKGIFDPSALGGDIDQKLGGDAPVATLSGAQKQQVGVDVSMTIDSEGRPKVNSIESTGGAELSVDGGIMSVMP